MTKGKEHIGKLISEIGEKQSMGAELGALEGFDRGLSLTRDLLMEQLRTLGQRRAFTEGSPAPEDLLIDGGAESLDTLLPRLLGQILEFGLMANSGSHLGYIPGGGIPTAALADLIAAVTNEYSGMEYASPGAAGIENASLEWIRTLFGFPETAQGTLTSGGSIANLTAMVTARDAYLERGFDLAQIRVLMSDQVHHSCLKAMRIAGLSPEQVIHIPTDTDCCISLQGLEHVIEENGLSTDVPVIIIASAGTTNTGSVDPLDPLAGTRDKYGWWLHVDGAYGGFFQLTAFGRIALKGIEKADSLVVDPHKGLFLPYGIGAVLVRNGSDLLRSFHQTASYLETAHHGDLFRNPADLSAELTRHFRGLRMWLPLKTHGEAPFLAMLEEKHLLCRYAHSRLEELGFSMGPEPELSVCWFYHAIPDDPVKQNRVNSKISELVNQKGRVFNSPSHLEGKNILRLAILSFRTDLGYVDRAIEDFAEAREKALSGLDDRKY